MLYRSDITLLKLARIIEDEVESVQVVNKDVLVVESLGCKFLCCFNNDNTLSLTSMFRESTPLKKINEWNSQRTIGRAYLNDADHTILQSDLYVGDGITEEQICGFIKHVAFLGMMFKMTMGD